MNERRRSTSYGRQDLASVQIVVCATTMVSGSVPASSDSLVQSELPTRIDESTNTRRDKKEGIAWLHLKSHFTSVSLSYHQHPL